MQAPADLANGANQSYSAFCPAGQQAIAGGGRGDDTLSEETILTNTRPAISAGNPEPPANGQGFTGWRITVVNPIGGAAVRHPARGLGRLRRGSRRVAGTTTCDAPAAALGPPPGCEQSRGIAHPYPQRMPSERLAIAHVTPYPWGSGTQDVTTYVERVTAELARRGHRVVIVAPSRSSEAVRETRQALRAAVDDPHALLPEPGGAAARARRRRRAAGPAGREPPRAGAARRRLAHDRGPPDDPAAGHLPRPRAVRALDVERRAAPLAGAERRHVPHADRAPAVDAGRPQGRAARPRAPRRPHGELRRHARPHAALLPGRLPRAAARRGRPRTARAAATDPRGSSSSTTRSARPCACSCARCGAWTRTAPWEATVVSARGPSSSTPLRADLEARVRYAVPDELTEAQALAGADVLVAASDGAAPAPGLVLRALNAGVVTLTSRLPVYEEALGEGEHGLLFEPRDLDTLAAQLQRLVDEPALRAQLAARAEPLRGRLAWSRVADELEEVYAGLVARRHPLGGDPEIAFRLRTRPRIDVDLHMHTDHSHDCATPVEVLLAAARAQGLGAIAVTDHNVITGALEARAKAAEFGMKVIVAEEVKTADQGEVIGLFIEEHIPRGMTLAETVAEIKRQGGLVYVPHPFDRMHAVPDYEHLLGIVDEIDAIEVYNPRVAIGSFNEEAERFAAKYRILAGAGSDSHVAPGLGSVRVRMADFDGPQEFLEACATRRSRRSRRRCSTCRR